jgi:hypothetical protein
LDVGRILRKPRERPPPRCPVILGVIDALGNIAATVPESARAIHLAPTFNVSAVIGIFCASRQHGPFGGHKQPSQIEGYEILRGNEEKAQFVQR